MGSARGGVCRVIILGSTGSIGTQTLEVIEHLNGLHARGAWPMRYEVVGLAGGRNTELLFSQAARCGARHSAVNKLDSDAVRYAALSSTKESTRNGPEAAERLVREVACDLVVAAMSGAAGLPATLAAAELGRDIALANKETLVAAGSLIVPAARKSGSRLLPVDSEHSAVWQCLCGVCDVHGHRAAPETQSNPPSKIPTITISPHHAQTIPAAPPLVLGDQIAKIILTASGGPFRTWSREQTYNATPEQALKHPTWTMGQKVTIDSASLTNKALEIIEAHWLFGVPAERIEAIIHPQSIVHAIVEMADGSCIAQLGAPDMRGPIQFALAFPHRPEGGHRRIPWHELRSLDFEPPDHERFPALGLAYRAIRDGGTAGAVLNAANEAAVDAFLAPIRNSAQSGGSQRGAPLPFGRITELTAQAMDALGFHPVASLDDVLRADAAARAFVRERVD